MIFPILNRSSRESLKSPDYRLRIRETRCNMIHDNLSGNLISGAIRIFGKEFRRAGFLDH